MAKQVSQPQAEALNAARLTPPRHHPPGQEGEAAQNNQAKDENKEGKPCLPPQHKHDAGREDSGKIDLPVAFSKGKSPCEGQHGLLKPILSGSRIYISALFLIRSSCRTVVSDKLAEAVIDRCFCFTETCRADDHAVKGSTAPMASSIINVMRPIF